jgi:hypothetical protein
VTTATDCQGRRLQDPGTHAVRTMASSSVRVVGPAALKTLMAYGGTVLDLRCEAPGVEALPERVAVSCAAPDQLILLLASDLPVGMEAAVDLQLRGYSCVVVVNAGADPAAAVPVERPG